MSARGVGTPVPGIEARHLANVRGRPRWHGEFWTAAQRQSSRLHEISYRACFKAQLPEFFIDRLSRPGERVYDPFMGRGTTPLQAALMGRIPAGNDINPLGVMLVRPRLAPPALQEICERLRQIPWRQRVSTAGEPVEDLEVFYHPDTLGQLLALRHWLGEREEARRFDAVDDWIRMVALNRLSGHSPGFFSVYTMPPNQAVSAVSQRKINRRQGQRPPPRDVPALILKKSRRLLSSGIPAAAGHPRLFSAPAWDTPGLGDASVSLIVCSPPFLDVVDYAGDNWLRCWFARVSLDETPFSMYRDVREWSAFVRRCFVEFGRIVRPGGHVAFEVGEVKKGAVELEHHVIDAIGGLPFTVPGVLVNEQRFSKTSNCWGVSNNRRGTNSNRIVLAQRTA